MLYDVYEGGGFKVKCAFFCPSRPLGICVLLLLFSQFFSLKNSKKRLLVTYLVVEGFFFVFLTALVFHLYIPFLFILCMLHYFHHLCTFVLLQRFWLKKLSLSLLHLLLQSASRESQLCTLSMNNISSRPMHYQPLSLINMCFLSFRRSPKKFVDRCLNFN